MVSKPVTASVVERRGGFWRGLLPARFRDRLLLAMVTLVLGSQLLAGYALSETVREDNLTKAARDLDVGRRVFTRILDNRSVDLLESVRVLSADFGFKSAVATRDTATIATVLANHGARIGADLVILLDNAGGLMASTRDFDGEMGSHPFPGLHMAAQREGEATAVGVIEQSLVQLVAVPVRAPAPIAWVMMGFEVDAALAAEMAKLTGLEVSFAGADEAAGWSLVSTLPEAGRQAMETRLPVLADQAGAPPFYALDAAYLTAVVGLPVVAPERGVAVLQMPAALITAAYQTLQRQFLLILLVTIALALLFGLGFAGGIAQPLRRLTEAAESIRSGHYGNRVQVRGGGGEIALLASAINDMQDGIAAREQQIRFHATHDELTGLPNRRFVEQYLEQRLREGEPFALLLLSIDSFRSINDALGYDVGDRVLGELAGRLRSIMRSGTAIARMGGDEFLVVMDGMDVEAGLGRGLDVRPHLSRPVELDGSPIAISVSLGVVASPVHGVDVNRLLRRADMALAAAKHDRQGVRAYQEGQDEQHLRELKLIRDLVGAIERRELTMAYQPKVRASDGHVDQVEALVRWEHPEFGFVPPDEFVFLAERAGLVRGLTAAVLDMVLDQLRCWRREGRDLLVCVNLSARDLSDAGLPQRIAAELARRDLVGADLVLEITESALLEEPELAVSILESLRSTGIHLAVDDFGTGYSSLTQLRRLPVSELKIDKSFVLELERSDDDRLIVESTIALGHALGLSVVAEGTETAVAWHLLEALGCDRLQGYFIARPMPAEQFAEWLANWNPARVKAEVDAA